MSFNAVNYFETAAIKHKSIKHSDNQKRFFRVRSLSTLDELLTNLPAASFPAIMVHDMIDGTLGDFSISNSYNDEPQVVFYVVDKVLYSEQDEQVADATNRCHTIGLSIISQMMRHRRQRKHGLQFLDMSRVPYQSVGPMADNVFGMMYMLNVINPIDLTFKTDDWDGSW